VSTSEQNDTKAIVQSVINTPRLTMVQMARAMDMNRRTLVSYQKGERNMPPESRRALVTVLEAHAEDVKDAIRALKATVPRKGRKQAVSP
jgi:hypothetical protein